MGEQIQIVVTENYKKKEYDKFVYNNQSTSVFQTIDMAEVYKRNSNTEPLILVAKNENNNEILASMLVKKIQEKNGFLSSLSLHSTIRGGPLFNHNEDGIRATLLLMEKYNALYAKKMNVLYTRIYPLFDTKPIIPVYEKNGYEYSGWNNFLFNLNRSIDDIWKTIEKSKRKNINRAKKNGLYVEEITEKKDIFHFYELLVQNYSRRKQPLEDINYFKDIYDILVSKGIAKFFVVKFKDEWAAVRLVLAYKGVLYDWYTASSDEYLSLYPNDFMVWHILNWGIENGFHTFDFGGGGTPEQVSEGWVVFKKRFGGTQVNYGRYTFVHHPKKLWLAKKGFDVYKTLDLGKKSI